MTLSAGVLWSLAATLTLLTIFEASHGLGGSRLNLPLVFGAFLTAHRTWANLLGLALYLIGGWVFALLYFWAFKILGLTHWTSALLIGFLHGVFLLVVLLPAMPYLHPRMATEYDLPTSERRLEPPGFIGLNYGLGTPLTALIGHSAYGLVLGLGYLHH